MRKSQLLPEKAAIVRYNNNTIRIIKKVKKYAAYKKQYIGKVFWCLPPLMRSKKNGKN